LLGSLLPWLEWTEAGLPLVGFGVAVLFLRRLPVIAALRRPLKLDAADTLFYGWFGPIGVAALSWSRSPSRKPSMTPSSGRPRRW